MGAAVRTTKNYDSAAAMAADLTRELPLNGRRGGLALLFCLPETPYPELYAQLCRELPLTVVGGTTFRLPFTLESDDCSAALTLFPETHHAIALSPPLDPAPGPAALAALHRDCLESLGRPPDMFISLWPALPSIMTGGQIPDLLAAIGETPCLGGVVSAKLHSRQVAVLADGQVHRNRLLLVGLAGGARPIFSQACEVTDFSKYTPTVTEADHHAVKRLDDLSFFNYLRWINCDPRDPSLISGYPVCAKVWEGAAGQGEPEASVRALTGLDLETSSGLFSGPVPVGSSLSLGFLTPENVRASTRRCLANLQAQVTAGRAAGQDYRLLFYVSCVGRQFAQIGQNDPEANFLKAYLPAGLTLSGYYGFGEISPVRRRDGRLENRDLSFSIAMAVL